MAANDDGRFMVNFSWLLWNIGVWLMRIVNCSGVCFLFRFNGLHAFMHIYIYI